MEIHFDPTTQVVTIKMLVQDPKGYFIPNIRRENFAVYEDGVRQENASVEIEHAAISVGVLLEYGGRYQALNESVGEADSAAASQLLGEIGTDDKVAIWTYGDKVEEIAGPLRIVDASGKTVHSKIIAKDSYIPRKTAELDTTALWLHGLHEVVMPLVEGTKHPL
jgi:hypothetical protein